MARDADMAEMAFELDSEPESDGEEEPVLAVRPRPGANQRMPLHQFLRLIAGGGRMVDHGAAASNDELVANLKRAGVVQCERVLRALKVCSRDLFVPETYREEAFVDAPIRVEQHDFNISAPHMHATCLEALQLTPGLKVLDVGSGCGVLTACLAYMVGRQGCVVGIDIRRECVRMGRDAIRRLTESSQDYSSNASPTRVELQNVFMPASRHLGAYDRVHVGASCPPDRLPPLLALLKPEGGLIVTPVAPNDLRVITKKPNGSVTQKVISQVRFSDLEVPTDAEVLLAAARSERRRRTTPPPAPSTFATDRAAIVSATSGSPSSFASCSKFGPFMPSSSPSGVLDGLPPTPTGERAGSWPNRFSKFLSSCSGSSSRSLDSGESRASLDSNGCDPPTGSPPVSPTAAARLTSEELGEPDCTLAGPGWSIPVHRSVLRQRCDHFRARCDSGMRDSEAETCLVPDHFSREAVEALLHYCYTDEVDGGMDPQSAVALLHVAGYYGCSRLVHLCEVLLGRMLRSGAKEGGEEAEGIADAAAALLALADDHGLAHLRSVCLDYIVQHYEQVSRTESFAALSKHQTEQIAAEACRLHHHLLGMLCDICTQAQQQLPDPT